MKFLKKVLILLATGSISIILAACYGPPTRLQNIRLIRAKDKSGNPIPGLKLKLYKNKHAVDSLMTNTNGEGIFTFEDMEKNHIYTISVEDVDKQTNGGYFLSREILVPDNSEIVDVTVSH